MTGLGQYLPQRIMTNDDLAALLLANRQQLLDQGRILTPEQAQQFETSDVWIQERTGIRERRIADPTEATSDLATKAGLAALQHSGLNKAGVQFIVMATVSHDFPYSPPTGALVQTKMGLMPGTAIFDLSAACSSFIHALALGYSMIRSNLYQRGLVIGADKMSTTVNWFNRDFSILLGDAGGAMVLEQTDLTDDTTFFLGADGNLANLIIAPAGGSKQPLTPELIADPLNQPQKLWMDGKQVFKKMVIMVPKIMHQALDKAGKTLADVDLLVFHQANLRIIEAVTERLQQQGLRPNAVVYNNIQRVGNTTSASIPLCLAEAYQQDLLTQGMTVMAVVFGGGMTWGTSIFRWPSLPEVTT
jgi:3-oxoacyl-[acyl-carrier-protein] synthase-3